jgi:hypothetical protein
MDSLRADGITSLVKANHLVDARLYCFPNKLAHLGEEILAHVGELDWLS